MKKNVLNLLVLFAFCGNMIAQSLAVADVEVLPGGTAYYALSINVGDGEYTGFQYDITFPSGLFSTPESDKSTVNASWTGGSITPGNLTDGTGRVSAMSTSLAQIPSGNIEIGRVAFKVAANMPLGEYDVTISNFEFLSGTERMSANDVTFKVKVVEILTITLDENSTEMPVASNGSVNVNLIRSIKGGNWQTIVLPFAMTETQVKDVFGESVELADFAGYTTEENDDEDIVGIKVNFNTRSSIEANRPCIIKVDHDMSGFSVSGVTIEPEDEPTVAVVKRTKKQWSELIGTYVAETIVGEDMLFLSGNKFYYSDGTVKMKGYRAYFDFYDVLSEYEASSGVKMLFDIDDDATSLEEFNNRQSMTNNIYDLSGRKINKVSQRGIYIVNGKKVIK